MVNWPNPLGSQELLAPERLLNDGWKSGLKARQLETFIASTAKNNKFKSEPLLPCLFIDHTL